MITVFIIVLSYLVVYLVAMPVICWIRARILIPQRIARLERDPDFPVNVIVPCHGKSEHLEANLHAIAAHDYPNSVTTFVTDTEDDPAVEAIEAVLRDNPRARHIVAGHAERASGKNHAQLVAIEQDARSEVFVIFDSDMRPEPNWLKEMVRPFVDPRVVVSSSSRWIVPHGRGLAPKLYTALESFRPLLLNAPSFVLLWGGFFAIRRKAFVDLCISDLWRKTENDDLVLCSRLVQHRIRPFFVPAAISSSYEVHASVSVLVKWFSRQALTGRLHAFIPWLLLLLSETLVCLALAGSVTLFAVQAALARIDWMSFSAPVFAAIVVAGILLAKLPYRERRDMSLGWWLIVPLLGHFIIMYALWKSVFERKMMWGSDTLEFNKDGTIARRIKDKDQNHP